MATKIGERFSRVSSAGKCAAIAYARAGSARDWPALVTCAGIRAHVTRRHSPADSLSLRYH